RLPDAVIVDRVGYEFFFPGQAYELGKTLELNDRRATIVGIYNSAAPFQNLPVFYSRYSQAINYVRRERNLLSFVLAKAAPRISDAEACRRIEAATRLRAATSSQIGWHTIWYYIAH